jgi:hypothetical protein
LIPVARQSEPADFAANVRRPGQAFLRTTPRPTNNDFRTRDFWKAALPQLRTAYHDICAYSSLWMPLHCTVDHYFPKSSYPHLAYAYEWSNYRLALDRINNNKGNSVDVLDPFTIQAGWFVLDMATLFVQPSAVAPAAVRTRVQRSIDLLRLNDDPLVAFRFDIVKNYLDANLRIEYIEEKYPFIAAEIRRLGIQPQTIATQQQGTGTQQANTAQGNNPPQGDPHTQQGTP